MKKSKSSRLDIQYFLSLITRYSLLGFACITVMLLLSSIFIKVSLDHQKRMLRISAITYEQRLLLRELNDTVNFLLRIAKRPLNKRLVDDVRDDIQSAYIKLNNNQASLEDLFTKRQFFYYYWPFNRFYANHQYDLIQHMREVLDDISPRINSLLDADYLVIETGFNLWKPGFLRTVRQGEHTLALEQLNQQVYQSALDQHGSLERLHYYLLLILVVCIWIIWLLILKPLTSRSRFLFNQIQSNEKKLRHQARHDSLTGLHNRHSLNQVLAQFKAKKNPALAVIAIDVDNFKMLNDTYGHTTGDAILKHLSQCIKATQSEDELQFRSGGDEFIIFMNNCQAKSVADKRIHALIQALNKPFNLENTNTAIQAKISIGAAYQNGDFQDANELYAAADIAMYFIKQKGGDNYAFYYDIETRKISEIIHIENALKKAIQNQQFIPHYQPIYNIQTNTISGFEALARWQHPDKGTLMPKHWMSIAERLGLMSQISVAIAKHVLEDQLRLQQQGLSVPRFTINLTEKLLVSQELFDLLNRFINKNKDYTFNIGIEIHESIVLQRNFKQLSFKIRELQQSGFKILIDDFGTGYATINHLLHLPFDYLKTDKALLEDLLQNPNNRVILKAMQNIAAGLGKHLICEGVEDEKILNILKQTGITYAQGFYFAKAMSFEKAVSLIEKNQPALKS